MADSEATNGYLPIADHGVIGDLRTAALIGADGRVDWFCAPRFDSGSVFGSILDVEGGGVWSLRPTEPCATRRQFYLPDTNILVTRHMSAEGICEVTDAMPIARSHDPDHRTRLVRRINCIQGSMSFEMRIAPRFDYGRVEHTLVLKGGGQAQFVSGDSTLQVYADHALERSGDDLVARIDLQQSDSVTTVLAVGELSEEMASLDLSGRSIEDTAAYWRDWLGGSSYTGRWREMVHRSALVLKLLTHEPTGAIIAAATAGLPEVLGGERNWDYRYVWLRDSAFTVYALMRLGFIDEADAFADWLTERFDPDHDGQGPLRLFYTVDGGTPVAEHPLGHWEGYQGSAPVLIGNGASGQLQLDIYGAIVDAMYLFNKYGPGITLATWEQLRAMTSWLAANWNRPDQSIWEMRKDPQHHVFSRLMSWVAFDRMIRISQKRALPGELDAWRQARDEIFGEITTRGWNDDVGSFTQTLDSEQLDASLLLMPSVKFLSAQDPRFLSTLKAIEETLVANPLVFRYHRESDDGLDGAEGSFSLCSFWRVEALTRAGRLGEAQLALEKLYTYANHVGLYAEEIATTGQQLGNFPQAFTHMSLISAATNLDKALG